MGIEFQGKFLNENFLIGQYLISFSEFGSTIVTGTKKTFSLSELSLFMIVCNDSVATKSSVPIVKIYSFEQLMY